MPKAFALGALFLFVAEPSIQQSSPQTILWAAPAILIAAMIIAWAAESSQFFMAQGFALAILAWMQTLPEFAMEAVFAWRQQVPFLFASLTGALRLLTGLGWPMIYCAAALAYRKRHGKPMRRILLHGEHSIQVIGLMLPLLYISFVAWKGKLQLIDAAVLIVIYAVYLILLGKMPPQEAEGIDDLDRVPRYIVRSPRWRRIALIGGLFLLGGVLIKLAAEPFLGSLFSISTSLGIPTFIFVQWVAPFISEFPEGLSTFYWARTVHRAPMALMNLVSSNINQWTLLVAMLPIVLSMSVKTAASIPLDNQQMVEVLMTIAQQLLGMLFLINMELAWWEATFLFSLWFIQFAFSGVNADVPILGAISVHIHLWVTITYFAWAAWELVRLLLGKRKPKAFTEFARMWRAHVRA